MTYFLEQVAKQIYESYKNDLSRQCVVFPNRRSGLFFMEYLSSLSDKPVWAPKTITINELFTRCSDLKIASTEVLVYELYKIYIRLDAIISRKKENKSDCAKIDETFDSFYFWGEMLVNDFDDIDKYIVNAKDLYTNLKDLHDIDDKFGGLSHEQIEIIRKFIMHFSDGEDTPQKRDFEFNWSVLFSLYNDFKTVLHEKGLAYEGMIARDVAETSLSMVDEKFDCDRFHFVGFNALNNCEKRMMKYLKGEDKASFYWDYVDTPFFKDDQRSSYFMIPDLEIFGQDLSYENRHLYVSSPDIKIVDIPSDVGQAKLLPTLLSDFEDDLMHGDQQKTAIILADENLMPAVLSSIPSYIEDVNITMGYAFSMTPVYSLIRSLLYIQQRYVRDDLKNYYDHKSVLSILNNPLVKRCAGDDAQKKAKEILDGNKLYVLSSFFNDNEFLTQIFSATSDAKELLQYMRDLFMKITIAFDEEGDEDAIAEDPLTVEFLFKANQLMNRLDPLLEDETFVDKRVLAKLMDSIFREIKVPFNGEPLKGLQVMGILESRDLDFDNIIMLSANEGILPKTSSGSSYIPYNLRAAFGMPTIDHQDSIFSYYFTRLLTRAKRLTYVYNSSSDGLKTGEMSRLLLRLKYNSDVNVQFISARMNMGLPRYVNVEREKSERDLEILRNRFITNDKSPLAPSTINCWIDCSMKFYYKYVCGLKEPKEILEGVDYALLGTVLHETAKTIYTPYIRQVVSAEIVKYLKSRRKENKSLIRQHICDICFKDSNAILTGSFLILSDMVEMFLYRIFDIDEKKAPFTIVDLEGTYSMDLSLSHDNIKIAGKIDRIDEQKGELCLIDYKTGSVDKKGKGLEEMFGPDTAKHNSIITQILMYCAILYNYDSTKKIHPVIYALRNGVDETFKSISVGGVNIETYNAINDTLVSSLRQSVSDIFNKDVPFKRIDDVDGCKYCPYVKLCGKESSKSKNE